MKIQTEIVNNVDNYDYIVVSLNLIFGLYVFVWCIFHHFIFLKLVINKQ